MKGYIIGDYKFEKPRIGKGAFSNIYKGQHIHSKLPVAVKEMPYDKIKKIRDNIKREFSLLKTLDHPNIIKLYDVFFDESSKNIYFMIDLYDNGDLSTYLNGRKIKEKYAKGYMRQIKDGLEYLYGQKILHRDLKPQNILVSKEKTLIITDFGFARYFETDIMLQTICGSPLYMAPEILLKKKYNTMSDLWSVGVIMYEMLCGNVPYESKNLIDLIHKIKKKDIIFPLEITANISHDCNSLLLSLLQKNPEMRCSWEVFFTHSWFLKNEINDEENKLLEISIKPGSSLPNLFKHRSIKESLSIDEEYEKTIHYANKNDNTIDEECIFDMNMNSSNENTDEPMINNILNDSTDSFISLESECEEIQRSFLEEPSSPIHIRNFTHDLSNQSTVYITRDMLHNQLNDSEEVTPNSLSESIKKYLKSSIVFLKESYKYISYGNTI